MDYLEILSTTQTAEGRRMTVCDICKQLFDGLTDCCPECESDIERVYESSSADESYEDEEHREDGYL